MYECIYTCIYVGIYMNLYIHIHRYHISPLGVNLIARKNRFLNTCGMNKVQLYYDNKSLGAKMIEREI